MLLVIDVAVIIGRVVYRKLIATVYIMPFRMRLKLVPLLLLAIQMGFIVIHIQLLSIYSFLLQLTA